ncbi:hypothetical protein MTX35_13695 [Rhodococcus sp. ARC_M12]|uniref:hypothetical protein n=1 Tax=Rhodococcus sp. ARC_M12 TaxID=2928854 RepID=UPI001FB4270D|nr:hypothetical protein [Rhodococcus sp. ARC_M12]MCJ0894949.1 hypothetical protein [Rhodococcus sp. ARC_M5]MCJ0978766.1 hypothetical protein [Rhodococcus sp. ARC_M12]
MIVEHALLHVIPHRTNELAVAFADAKSIISSMPGFVNPTPSRRIEHFAPRLRA